MADMADGQRTTAVLLTLLGFDFGLQRIGVAVGHGAHNRPFT